ncbi:DUF2812 domain-containing protein [Aminipila sp.]|uniref:DUF2812 domain-containing protein n=1 Tax=Aminipila sp. TaxID=2060095 RepID=UPI00289C7FC9|nr:DUF2812 domain-containing protein [Aminipila sp.]
MKHIFRDFNFDIYDYKDAEKFLNEMALKGFEFKGTGKGYIKDIAMFEKNHKAKNLKYAIDVRKNLLNSEREQYYEFYKDLGWRNIDCFNDKLHMFVAEKENAFPLYTDELTEMENFGKAIKRDNEIFKYLLMAVCMVAAMGIIIAEGGKEFNRLVAYIIIVYFGCFALFSILEIIANLVCIRRFSKHMQTGGGIPASRLKKELRLWESFFSVVAISVFPLIIIVSYSYEIWSKGLNSINLYGSGWEIVLLIILCTLSIPIELAATYMLFLYPEKEKYKLFSYIGFFMFYISIFQYFRTYLGCR